MIRNGVQGGIGNMSMVSFKCLSEGIIEASPGDICNGGGGGGGGGVRLVSVGVYAG